MIEINPPSYAVPLFVGLNHIDPIESTHLDIFPHTDSIHSDPESRFRFETQQ